MRISDWSSDVCSSDLGLSLEYDIQLYFRRAKLLALIAGNPMAELDRVADRLWDGKTSALPTPGNVEIDFDYGAEAEAYAAELRSFVEANMTPDVLKKKHHSTSEIGRASCRERGCQYV